MARQAILGMAADSRDYITLRRELLYECEMGQVLQEVDAAECQEWKTMLIMAPTTRATGANASSWL
jgi:hypothetical protein